MSATKAAEAYLAAIERLKEKVAKLEAENEKLREQLAAAVRHRIQDYNHKGER